MNACAYSNRPRARWIVALTLCGSLLGFAASAEVETRSLGTVIGVPMEEMEGFMRANALPGKDSFGRFLPANNVTVLHVAPEFNSSIATVSVTRKENGRPAPTVYFPTFGNPDMARVYRQINAFDAWSFPQLFGEGYTSIVKVVIEQSNTGNYSPARTRFVSLPWESLPEIIGSNPAGRIRLVHRSRAHIGGGDRNVCLAAVEVDSAASDVATLQVPSGVYGADLGRLIRSLNTRVTLLGTVSAGSGPRLTTIVIQ